MRKKNGDWVKETGGYGGAVYLGKWVRFECIYCLKDMGLAKRQVPYTKAALEAMAHGETVFRCEGRHK